MNIQIYEEASEWIVKHREGTLDAGERKTFDAWLRESPQHLRAYLEMSSIWEDVPSLDRGWNPPAEELIERARADQSVVSIDVPAGARPRAFGALREKMRARSGALLSARAHDVGAKVGSSSRSRIAGSKLGYALAASLLAAIAGTWFYLQRDVYGTDVGEQRSLALTDGSTVELNSRSRIKVRYSDEERRIDLLEGQALFRVARDKVRPFVVQAENTRVRAVGTAFDVYRRPSGTVVTVVEGRVSVQTSNATETPEPVVPVVEVKAPLPAIRSGSNAAPDVPPVSANTASKGEALLGAGEQLVVTPKSVSAPARADVTAATAWTRRSLVFDSSPLTEVAQEFNRYNTRRLVIDDPALVDFHVSGVFSSVEPALLIRFLQTQPELIVTETDAEIRIGSR
jgi:transmembrane sensor